MHPKTTPFRVIHYSLQGAAPRPGLLVGENIIDLQAGGLATSMDDLLAHWSERLPLLTSLATSCHAAPIPLAQATLYAPVPTSGTVYCAGANYHDHIAEMAKLRGTAVPPLDDHEPWHFIKPTRACVTGPGKVQRPEGCSKLDWEAELAVVIGVKAYRVSVAEALSFVAGYTVANDLSARDLSRRAARPPDNPFYFDWLAHKGFDGSCPIGPWLTPATGIDPQNLQIKLAVNGVNKQDSNTSEMIFSVAEQIAQLSRRTTLLPGDIILTGTPAGVGSGRNEYLGPGDRVSVVVEGLGELVNTIVDVT